MLQSNHQLWGNPDQIYKHDEGKLRYDLIPPEVLRELAKVLTYGAKKYSPESWKSVDPKRYYAAMMRHLIASQLGESEDPESGINHISHALCNLAFLTYFIETANK